MKETPCISLVLRFADCLLPGKLKGLNIISFLKHRRNGEKFFKTVGSGNWQGDYQENQKQLRPYPFSRLFSNRSRNLFLRFKTFYPPHIATAMGSAPRPRRLVTVWLRYAPPGSLVLRLEPFDPYTLQNLLQLLGGRSRWGVFFKKGRWGGETPAPACHLGRPNDPNLG